MSDATPPPTTPKTILASLTFWVQVLTFIAALFPAVQAFIVQNPETAVAVLGAVNVLVRFASSGRVLLFPSEEMGTHEDRQDGRSGGMNPCLLGLGAAVALMGALPSCSAASGWSVIYQDPMTDARVVIYGDSGK